MSRAWRLILVFAIQAAVLVYMIADRQWTLASGTPVVLETVPVDPRSLFSGDYVRLDYRISRLSFDSIGGDKDFREHDVVYVLLRRGEPYWEPVSAHHAYQTPPAEHVMLRGQVERTATLMWDADRRRMTDARVLYVRYGIESYFVPEGEGRAIERPAPGEKVSIRVAVDVRGRAAIQALLINGKERYLERLF